MKYSFESCFSFISVLDVATFLSKRENITIFYIIACFCMLLCQKNMSTWLWDLQEVIEMDSTGQGITPERGSSLMLKTSA